jgi:hypothetical protein
LKAKGGSLGLAVGLLKPAAGHADVRVSIHIVDESPESVGPDNGVRVQKSGTRAISSATECRQSMARWTTRQLTMTTSNFTGQDRHHQDNREAIVLPTRKEKAASGAAFDRRGDLLR